MTRTDIHAPGSDNFDPEQYEIVAVFDLTPDFPQINDDANALKREAIESWGARFSGVHGTGFCDHCGAAVRYAALMYHTPTNGLIWIGERCLDNRFSGTKADFQRLKQQAAKDRQAQRIKSKFDALCEQHPTLAYVTYAINMEESGANAKYTTTMCDIVNYARRRGEISDKQLDLLDKLMTWLENSDRKQAEFAREKADALPAPSEGKHVFEGEIIKSEFRSNPYGPGGSEKITIKTDDGWVAWGSLPSRLENSVIRGGEDPGYKGRRIRIHATIQPSDRDDKFAFFKRPLKESQWLDL